MAAADEGTEKFDDATEAASAFSGAVVFAGTLAETSDRLTGVLEVAERLTLPDSLTPCGPPARRADGAVLRQC